jgi:hypothetical protein
MGNLIIPDHKYKTSGKTKNKTGERHPEGLFTDPRNMIMEEMSKRQRRM